MFFCIEAEKVMQPKDFCEKAEETDATSDINPSKRTIIVTASTEIDNLDHLKMLFTNKPRSGCLITHVDKLSSLKAAITYKHARGK